ETLTTLDDKERALVGDDLLICDGERPVALAGVMGGLATEVTGATQRILLEAASFHPTLVRRTSRRLGLISEASYRFERGVDPEGCARASARAAKLLAELGGGRVAGGLIDAYPRPRKRTIIELRPQRARDVLGVPLADDTIVRHLGALGLGVDPAQDVLVVT